MPILTLIAATLKVASFDRNRWHPHSGIDSHLLQMKSRYLINEKRGSTVVYGIDDELYDRSLKKWKALIGDSLFLLNELRQNKLISENIAFDLNRDDLENIRLGTNCDYIINTKIRILNEELSALSTPRAPVYTGTTERSNEAVVQVRIYT